MEALYIYIYISSLSSFFFKNDDKNVISSIMDIAVPTVAEQLHCVDVYRNS